MRVCYYEVGAMHLQTCHICTRENHMLYPQSQDKNLRNWEVFLTSLLLTEPVCGASLIYSSIVARNDGGGC